MAHEWRTNLFGRLDDKLGLALLLDLLRDTFEHVNNGASEWPNLLQVLLLLLRFGIVLLGLPVDAHQHTRTHTRTHAHAHTQTHTNTHTKAQ